MREITFDNAQLSKNSIGKSVVASLKYKEPYYAKTPLVTLHT